MRSGIALATVLIYLSVGPMHGQVEPDGAVEGLSAKFVDVKGVRTRYYDYGQGETIVLLHGGSALGRLRGHANTWSHNIPGLARKFWVLALDRLAQGMTDNPKDDKGFGIEGDVEHIYEFIRAMNVNSAHVVGHSSGSTPAVYLALKHPDVVKSVILVSAGSGHRSGARPNKLSQALAKCPSDTTSNEYRRCFRNAAFPREVFSPEYEKADQWIASLPKAIETNKRVAALRSQKMQINQEEAAHHERIWESVRNGALQVPVLMYNGNQDLWDWDADGPHATLSGALNLFHTLGANNPRVKMVVVHGAGHFVYRERPEHFNADLMQFIDFWKSNTHLSRAR